MPTNALTMPDIKDVFFLIPHIILTVWGLLVLLVDVSLFRRKDPIARRNLGGWLSMAGRGSGPGRGGVRLPGRPVSRPVRVAVQHRRRSTRSGTRTGRSSSARCRATRRWRTSTSSTRPPADGPLALDGVVVHRGVGRVFRPDVLGHGGHDAADGLRGAGHALHHARDDDHLPVPLDGDGEVAAAIGGGGPEVLRLWLGLLGAVPVRIEPALRPDGDDLLRRDLAGRHADQAAGRSIRRAGARRQRRGGDGGPADAGGLRVQGGGGAVPPVGARRL